MEESPLLEAHKSSSGNEGFVQKRFSMLQEMQSPIGSFDLAKRVKSGEALSRLKYYIPFLNWIGSYKLSMFQTDVVAGITVAAMLIPQSLAYSSLAGLPSIYGLQSAFYPLVIYFFLGTSKHLSIGPEAMVSILVGILLQQAQDAGNIDGSTEEVRPNSQLSPEVIALAPSLSFLVGGLMFAAGLFRFGFLTQILSRSFLCGFVNAVAVVVIIEQMDEFTGIAIPKVHSLKKLPYLFEKYQEVHYPTVIIGTVALFLLLLSRYSKRKFSHIPVFKYIPDTFVVVVLGVTLTRFLGLDRYGVVVLEAGLLRPSLPIPTASQFPDLISSAGMIATIGVVESVMIAKYYATKHKYAVSTNRELIALGASNLFGSVFGTIPAFGSLSRSSVNERAGGSTPMSSLITAILILCTILFLLPVFSTLPLVVMAGIIINAALGLFEVSDVIFLFRVKAWKDLFCVALTFFVTLIFGAEGGIIVALVTSLLLVVRHTSSPHVAIMKKSPDSDKFEEFVLLQDLNLFHDKQPYYFAIKNRSEFDGKEHSMSGVLMLRIEEGLYFANIGKIKELFLKIERTADCPLRAVVLDFTRVSHIDASACQILVEMVKEWRDREIPFCIAKMRPNLLHLMKQSGLAEISGIDCLSFTTKKEALDYVLDKLNLDAV